MSLLSLRIAQYCHLPSLDDKYFRFLILAITAMGHCSDESKNAELLSAGNNKFTAKMFLEVAKSNLRKSFVLSAFSLLTPLAQLSLASEGSSHDELLGAIGLPDDESTKSVFSFMGEKFKSVKGIDLKMASKIYVANKFSLNDDYVAMSRDTFQSDVQSVDFRKNLETAEAINNWVEDQTNHRIKDLVDPSTLTTETAAVLVNAIYFKGTWKNRFNNELTRDNDFHVSREKTVKVPMMFQKGHFNYGDSKELDAKILEIPYEGDESAFYVILPNDVEGINELEKKIESSSALDNALNNIFYAKVNAYIPKFKIETKTNLNEILPKVGVSKIFDPEKANLNKLLKETSELYVTDAIQKAFIEINEEGAEASAANEIQIGVAASLYPPPTIDFVADRPFVFILKAGGTVLFTGVYSSE